MQKQSRLVCCQDALEWLNSHTPLAASSIVASLPDISEFPNYSLEQWKQWFIATARLIISRCPENGVVIFYQSDIKYQGTWVDKAYLCQKAAELERTELLWHKIICRSPAGLASYGRPAYSHILCFSQALRPELARSTPDVLPVTGEKTWQRGMGLEACLMISRFIKEQTSSDTIINPFCGEGSMLAAANFLGLNAIGIERSPKRARKARQLLLGPEGKSWSSLDVSHEKG